MKILISGINGYMGTALYFHLKEQGHEVIGFDNDSREFNVKSIGSNSITEKAVIPYNGLNATDYESLKAYIEKNNPDTIIWLAEQPSAPFSMINQRHATDTMNNNMQGTLNVLYAIKEVNPKIHLIKIGTEGEYPADLWKDKHIPEGDKITVQYKGEDWEIPTPRGFGSIYHSTKLSSSQLISWLTPIWGLRVTDVNQGIVFGHVNGTRLDVDYYFGTVVHRFVAQAVSGIPLTVYGEGGQTRGMICLQNSLESLQLLSENPAKQGDFRVVHQTGYEYSVNQVAKMIQDLTGCKIEHIENPRVEMPRNKFTFDTSTLDKLGLKKIRLDDELPRLIKVVEDNKDRIIKESLMPQDHAKWS